MTVGLLVVVVCIVGAAGGPDAPSDKKMYGFGAAADVVMYIPFLRNIMGWLSGGPASYKALMDGLTKVRQIHLNPHSRRLFSHTRRCNRASLQS